MKTFLLAVMLVLGAGTAQAQWDMNDVSILLPLPKGPGEDGLLWAPQTVGGQGILLPTRLYSALPRITSDLDPQTMYAKALKVVSLRLDPCFTEGISVRTCQRQIRVVLQPLVFEENSWATLDAAIHIFYALNEAEWTTVATSLRPAARLSGTAGLPLQVHPVISREGLRGPTWQKISSTLLPLIGEARIVRATAMAVNPLGNVWFFSGLEVMNGKLARMNIPRVPEQTQGFFVDAGLIGSANFRAAISPGPDAEPMMKRILFNSKTAPQELSQEDLQTGVREALRLQNPQQHHTGTSDCVSCHVSQTVTVWAARSFPTWNWNQLFSREIYRGPGHLGNTTVGPGRANVIRAFGYFDRDPIVSPRTVNETSEVVRMMLQEQPRLERRRLY